MRNTPNYLLNQPERDIDIPDPADIEVLNENMDIVDAALKKDADDLYDHRNAVTLDHPNSSVTTSKIASNAVTTGKLATGAVTTEKIADEAVTDAKIGNRFIGAVTGALQALLTTIGDAIKGMKGTTNWNDAPPTTLTAAKAHIDSRANPHEVTKAQVGLGNADNTSDANKPVSTAQAAAIKVVQDDVASHKADAVKHITAAERTAWNGKENAFTKNTAFNKNFGSAAGTVTEGNDARLSNARPASDVSAWAKATTKPVYTAAEVGLGNVTNDAQVKKSEVVQVAGTSTTNVMSQKAVTDALSASGNGDMLKSVYDTNGNSKVDTADKADILTTARTISLTGGVTGSTTFNGGANASMATTLANFDASKITSGILPIARGGTGNATGTAAKTASALTFTGAETGSFDGSAAKSVNIPKLYTTSGTAVDGAMTQKAATDYMGYYPKVSNAIFIASSGVLQSTADNFGGIVQLLVEIYPFKARVTGKASILTNTNPTNIYTYGLTPVNIINGVSALNSEIAGRSWSIPGNWGRLNIIRKTSTVLADSVTATPYESGYGSIMQFLSSGMMLYGLPARIYTTTGAVGGWGQNSGFAIAGNVWDFDFFITWA